MKKTLPGRIYGLHGLILKLGPLFGGPLVKLIGYYALYKIFTNGGVEALAYIAYEHMLIEGEKERKQAKHGTQGRMRENKRP